MVVVVSQRQLVNCCAPNLILIECIFEEENGWKCKEKSVAAFRQRGCLFSLDEARCKEHLCSWCCLQHVSKQTCISSLRGIVSILLNHWMHAM